MVKCFKNMPKRSNLGDPIQGRNADIEILQTL